MKVIKVEVWAQTRKKSQDGTGQLKYCLPLTPNKQQQQQDNNNNNNINHHHHHGLPYQVSSVGVAYIWTHPHFYWLPPPQVKSFDVHQRKHIRTQQANIAGVVVAVADIGLSGSQRLLQLTDVFQQTWKLQLVCYFHIVHFLLWDSSNDNSELSVWKSNNWNNELFV